MYRNAVVIVIKCSKCGSTIIPYPKTKKLASGEMKTYLYAKCSSKKRCGQAPIPVPELEKQLDQMLRNIKISEDFHDWFMR